MKRSALPFLAASRADRSASTAGRLRRDRSSSSFVIYRQTEYHIGRRLLSKGCVWRACVAQSPERVESPRRRSGERVESLRRRSAEREGASDCEQSGSG